MNTPALVLAGSHSACGKTTLSLGIMAALTRRGLRVQAFKVGPDYIDPQFHSALTSRPSRNLDNWILGPEMVGRIFRHHAAQADIALVEGVMGLFDGIDGSAQGSTAEMAGLLGVPVALVVDAAGASLSCAALVKGFAEFDPQLPIRAVIFNRVGSERHYRMLKDAVEAHTRVQVLGYLAKDQVLDLPSRHLGLVPVEELTARSSLFDRLVGAIERTVDLKRLQALALTASPPAGTGAPDRLFPPPINFPGGKGPVIAVARDRAFNFYYADNLDLLESLGARLAYFSPIADQNLPAGCSGLYLGGGYPEVFAAELAANAAMRAAIRDFALGNGPVYGECGGFMYLNREIEGHPMVGLFPGKATMTNRLQRFGYVRVETGADSVIAKAGSSIRAHEFHYSAISGLAEAGVPSSYAVEHGRPREGQGAWACGYRTLNTLGAYPHLHFLANPGLARRFVMACADYTAGGFTNA